MNRQGVWALRITLNRWGRASASMGGVALAGVLAVASCQMVRQDAGTGAPPEPEQRVAAEGGLGPFTFHVARSGREGGRISLAGLPMTDDALMLYEHQFGIYPRIWKGRVEHGGTPIGLDLVAHTRKLREDLDRFIPDENFDGLAVLNYETRPVIWKKLGEDYRDVVRGKIRAARPGLGAEEIDELSELAYDEASKRYLRTTLQFCKRLRPRAKWGIYFFPGGTYEREDYDWVADACDVMMPSIYPFKKSVSGVPENSDQAPASVFSNGVVRKMRLSEEFAGEKKVYAFVSPLYHDGNPRYRGTPITDEDARSIILRPEEEGVDGLIFWLHTNSRETAELLEEQLRRLEPMLHEAQRRRAERIAGG